MAQTKYILIQAIKRYGLATVLQDLEEAIEKSATSYNEWEKEFKKADYFAEKNKKNPSINYTGNLTISKLAFKRYGIQTDSDLRCSCPIHNGKNKTSFKFNDEMNTFHCFSCGAKGNMVHFVKLMEKKK